MKRRWLTVLIILAAAGAVAAGYWLLSGKGRISTGTNPETVKTSERPDDMVVRVDVIPARKGSISEDISVYGTITPAPGGMQVLSVPFESRALHIKVSSGQKVSSRDILLNIEPSPDTYLKLEETRNAYRLAEQSLKQMQQRFDLKLSTNDQLLQARQTFEQTRLQLESMKKQGINGRREIRAVAAGFISKVNIQEGAIVPAGNPLVEIVAQNRLEALLGIEPEDINHVRPGSAVSLFHVNSSSLLETAGRIRKISSAINPATRLVDVFVTLPPSSDFLLDEYILGKITIARAQGVVVPRSAVLPEGDRYTLFIVEGGRAVKHVVEIGLKNEKEVEVTGTGLKPGDLVVVLGNYELRDGMVVKTMVTQ